MKRLLLVIILFVVCFKIAFSQVNNDFNLLEGLSDINRNVEKEKRQSQMKKSKLNYYLDETWQAGVYYTKTNTPVNGLLFRYNIYTDQIELRSVIDHNNMDIISIGSKKFIYSQYLNEDSTQDEGYFELLVNGDCKLLIRRNIAYTERSDADNAYGSAASTKIVEKYYIKKNNDVAVVIDKSKESIANILSDKDAFSNYIDDKLLIFITEKKLMEIIKHYNNI